MKYYISIILLLLSLFPVYLHTNSISIFAKNTMIAYPETGLFLDYVGLYTPSETIIHNSAIFPMTTATCHFLPLSAAKNIPSCNITSKRNKRLIGDIISIGFGAASLGMSISNTIQIGNLQQQVALVKQSLSQFSQTMQIHAAHLAKIESDQIRLAEELQVTQQALSAMMPILSSHSEALSIVKTGLEQLHTQLQRSFLYLALTQILRNQLTLNFLSPDDLHKVIYNVIEQGDVTFNSQHESIPIAEIITKLLVRQQIDFVPRSQYITQDPMEIGRLVITSFFAVPQQEQTPFHIYKLLAIPFFHKNEIIQLTPIPRYWAINPEDNTTMEWHDPQESGCDLQLMTSCRDTPPLLKLSNDTCFGQIMGNGPLFKCQTTLTSLSTFFVRQLRDNLWVTSSPEPLHCLRMPKTEYPTNAQQTWNMNEPIILPPVAFVNVTPGYTIVCPRFTLMGHPIISNVSSLKIMYNNSLFTSNTSIVDVYRHLTENTTWFNRKPIKLETDGIMSYLHQPIRVPNLEASHPKRIWSLAMLILSCVFFGLTASLIYYVFWRKRRNNLQNL